jgi:hypothetical protein
MCGYITFSLSFIFLFYVVSIESTLLEMVDHNLPCSYDERRDTNDLIVIMFKSEFSVMSF